MELRLMVVLVLCKDLIRACPKPIYQCRKQHISSLEALLLENYRFSIQSAYCNYCFPSSSPDVFIIWFCYTLNIMRWVLEIILYACLLDYHFLFYDKLIMLTCYLFHVAALWATARTWMICFKAQSDTWFPQFRKIWEI